jgi:hypothetical protein
MKRRTLLTGLATLLAQTSLYPALAEENGSARAQIMVEASAIDVAGLESSAQIADTELDGERGGHAVTLANQSLTAISTGSVINGNYNAGGVSISDNALSNFNGIGNVLINTGAQNNLQSGMNVVINIIN